MQNSGKFSIFCLLILAQLFSTVTLAARPTKLTADQSPIVDRVYRDRQGIPFLKSKDGSRGRYLKISRDKLEIEISREQLIGTVRLQRMNPLSANGEVALLIEYETANGNQLTFGTSSNSDGRVESSIKLNDSEVRIDPRSIQKDALKREETTRRTEILLAGASTDQGIRNLVKESLPFLSRTAILKIVPPIFSDHQYVSDCAVEATDCLVSLVAYGMSMSALYSSCGFTLGAGCIAALLAHPIMSGAVVIYCGRAMQSCGLTQ